MARAKKGCTCNPHDLFFEECSCANPKYNDYGDSWINDFTTILDGDLPDPDNRTFKDPMAENKTLDEQLASDIAVGEQVTTNYTFQERLGLVPVGVNADINNSNDIVDRKSPSSHQPEDDHQGDGEQELEGGSLNLGASSSGSFHQNEDGRVPETVEQAVRAQLGEYNNNNNNNNNIPFQQDGQHTEYNNNLGQADVQYTEYNNNPFQQDVQPIVHNNVLVEGDARVANEGFCHNFPTDMDWSQFRKAGLDTQSSPYSTMVIQGGAGQYDFTQERADYNNVMSFSDMGNSGSFTSGFMQPTNISTQNNNHANLFNTFGSGLGPMPYMYAQSSSHFWDNTSTPIGLLSTQTIGSGHVNGNVSTQLLASQGRPTTLPRDEPQVLNDDEVFARDQAAARANVRRSQEDGHAVKVRYGQEAGQAFHRVQLQNQQSAQRPSAQTVSVSRAALASKKLSVKQLSKQPVKQPSFNSPAKPTSAKKLSANQIGRQAFPQPVPQPAFNSCAGPSSKKRPRPADIQILPEASKRARATAPAPAPALAPFTAEVEADVARGRAVKALLKMPWQNMTQVEKARMLLPMINGQHPLEFEKDEKEQGLSFGTIRQREALQKTMHLRNEAVADAASAPKKTPILAEVMDEDDELAALKARMDEIEANKKAKIAEAKRLLDNDKRAAAMRRKRQVEKEVKQAAKDAAQQNAQPEEAAKNAGQQTAQQTAQQQMVQQHMVQQQVAQQATGGVKSIAEEQVRLAQESQEQQMLENPFSQENPYARLGFASARSYEP
jgi:hypothetical protein